MYVSKYVCTYVCMYVVCMYVAIHMYIYIHRYSNIDTDKQHGNSDPRFRDIALRQLGRGGPPGSKVLIVIAA